MYIIVDDVDDPGTTSLNGVVTDVGAHRICRDAYDVAETLEGHKYCTMPEGDVITLYYMGVAPIDETIERTRPKLFNQDED